jgi:hypothetical protein
MNNKIRENAKKYYEKELMGEPLYSDLLINWLSEFAIKQVKLFASNQNKHIKEIQNHNKMRNALIEISKYETVDKLRRDSEKEWGIDFDEALEMAYENMQNTAKYAVKNIRNIKL